MKSFGIILASHGDFAKAALGSAEMIVGKQEDVVAFGLGASDSAEKFEQDIVEAYENLKKTCENVLYLCDIYGGTPFNTISRCKVKGMDVTAFTGLSLPLLIEVLMAGDVSLEEMKDKVLDAHQQALAEIIVELENDEDDDLDL